MHIFGIFEWKLPKLNSYIKPLFKMGHFSLFENILSYFSQNPLDHTLQTVNTCHVSWEWWRVRFKDTAVGFQLRIRQSKVDISRVRVALGDLVEWNELGSTSFS